PDRRQGSPEFLSFYWMYVFDQENFQGRMIEINAECMNISLTSSCALCGFVGFEQMNFCGEMYILEKSEYPRWDSWSNCQKNDYLLSFRPVRMDPEKYKICLYEVGEYKGRKMEIMDDDVPSLFSYGFTDRVGSIMVSCGTWVGYQFPGYRGSQYLLEKGEYRHFNEYGARCPQFQSVRRIRDMQWHPHDQERKRRGGFLSSLSLLHGFFFSFHNLFQFFVICSFPNSNPPFPRRMERERER
uniref:Beta-crystallin B1-like n=1 Tax=Sinocyclocheilus anshuiensis TaxID=1608454 RepID=A0A671L1Z7_9TELE